MIKYLRLPFSFDIQKLQSETSALLKSPWKLHYQVLHYDGNWSGLPLRSIDGNIDNLIIAPDNNTTYKDTVFLEHSPYLQKVLQSFQCELLAARLLNLTPGSIIKEHRDAELNFEQGEARFHIPIFTNEHVEFLLDKEPMKLSPGECWYMNFNLPHSLANRGQEDRIHLVIDAVVNDWLIGQFNQPELLRKDMEQPGYDEATRQMIIAQLRSMNTETGDRLAESMSR